MLKGRRNGFGTELLQGSKIGVDHGRGVYQRVHTQVGKFIHAFVYSSGS